MNEAYIDFKERVKNFSSNESRVFLTILENVNHFYGENYFKFFYPKNIYNDKSAELYFFFENGYLVVSKTENKYHYDQYYCKVLSKKLETERYKNTKHILKINFDSGIELTFDNLNDSNHDWEEEYCELIRELYKIV